MTKTVQYCVQKDFGWISGWQTVYTTSNKDKRDLFLRDITPVVGADRLRTYEYEA